MATQSSKKLKIPTQTLPDGWRRLGAEAFNVTESMIEKVVYGINENKEIFRYMVELAEKEKERRDAEDAELQQRLIALTQ